MPFVKCFNCAKNNLKNIFPTLLFYNCRIFHNLSKEMITMNEIARCISKVRRECMVIIVFAASIGAAWGSVDPNPYVMTEPTIFTAAAGTTNVYSGLISGTGPAIIEGGGTVAFSNPDNTYTGGTLVSNAVFRLDADGCAGTGAITGAISTAHIFMNCAVVPNDLIMQFAADCQDYMSPGAYPAAKQNSILPLCPEVTVKGRVSFNGQSYIFDSTSPALVSSPTVIFEKGITNGAHLHLVPKGRMIFKGPYIATGSVNSYFGCRSGASGTIEFQSSSNVLYRAEIRDANIDLKAVDAFPNTLFYYRNSSGGCAYTHLNGNDQTILGISWGGPNPSETGSPGLCFTSEDEPATVRIKGCEKERIAGSLVNKLALFGKITLVMDVDPAYTAAGFFQDFSVRRSTTTGDLIISNGDFRVSGTASFPNVPNIYVGTGGSFTNASTKAGAFAGCRNLTVLGKMACTGDHAPFAYDAVALTLGSDAEFSLPAGATVTVSSLTVGNRKMPDGTYGDGGTATDQILQGTVVVRGHDRYVDCNTVDTVNDGSKEHPFRTIRDATSSALSGDVIHVAEGTYGAAEGAEKHHEDARTLTRVIIPENVTIVASGRRDRTIIVGAPATGADANGYGNGPGAVRCVFARDGAVLRGFTLTGGHTGTDAVNNDVIDSYGAAFRAENLLGATVEDCMISNNCSHVGTLTYAKVSRCFIVGNFGGAGDGYHSRNAFTAGANCSYFCCVIDGNRGESMFGSPRSIESCTIGAGNRKYDGNTSTMAKLAPGPVLNSVFSSSDLSWDGTMYATNCIFADASISMENSSNCLVGQSAEAIRLDEDYRLHSGSVAIDFGNNSIMSRSIADEDIYGAPRVLNRMVDAGAVEYDWLPVFMGELGRRFRIEYASPTVTTNATGGLLMIDGMVAGRVTLACQYELTFNVTGGSLGVYVGGALVGESSGGGEQTIRFKTAETDSEMRIVFTSGIENQDKAILKRFLSMQGFTVTFR